MNLISSKKYGDILKLALVADGYRRGLEGPLLEYASKKFCSHRRIPDFVMEQASLLGTIIGYLVEKIKIFCKKGLNFESYSLDFPDLLKLSNFRPRTLLSVRLS